MTPAAGQRAERIEIVAYDRPGAFGAEARRGGRRVGLLLGRQSDDEAFGRSVWARPPDLWLAGDEEPELYRDLYALAGRRWVEAALTDHYAVVPAEPAVLEAWHGLSFARQQVYASRSLTCVTPLEVPGVSVRRGGPEDVDHAVTLADVIRVHQLGAPVWARLGPAGDEENRRDWAEFLADESTVYFLAFPSDARAAPLGHLALVVEEGGVVSLAVAATRRTDPVRGAGRALTAHALAWASEHGYQSCRTDWRVANLLSSRFWPRQGFEPTAYRMVRHVRP